MRLALREAAKGEVRGEVPVGAVVVAGGRVLGRGFNRPISAADPTAHAEVVALRRACKSVGNYRLTGATLCVTVEPCVMCVGALMHARVSTLIYGASEPKFGAVRSGTRLEILPSNHRLAVIGGVLETECADILKAFFRRRRKRLS